MLKIDLPDEAGENVISIEVSAKYRYHEGYCEHLNITVNEDLAELTCKDCKDKINPTYWIMMVAKRWHHIDYLQRTYKIAAELYDDKQRCKCEHCGRITHINPPTQFDRKLKEKRDAACKVVHE